MKWKKLGQIFNPTEHTLLKYCKEFAQSPQVLVFDHFIRVYFSTRERCERTKKYISHIAYVDMDENFQPIKPVSHHVVLAPGELGTFDEHGIFPINLVRNNNRILAYTCGWSRRVSVPVETSIGICESFDNGKTFQRLGPGPILTSSLDEPFLVGDPFVKMYNGVWHMWYIAGTKWMVNTTEEIARVYKIRHATSTDGFDWKKTGTSIITDRLHQDECQALPSVFFWEGRYHMIFCFREPLNFRKSKSSAYRLGYASSNDLFHWTRDDSSLGITVSVNGWDSDMMCYPHTFLWKDKVFLFYNGNDFGRYGFGAAVLEN